MFRLPAIPRAALGPILLASLLVLLIVWRTPPPRPSIAPPSAVSSFQVMTAPEPRVDPAATPPVLPDPLAGNFVLRNDLEISIAPGLYSAEQQARMVADLDRALSYVSQRFGSGPSGRITAQVVAAPGCGINGIAYTERRLVQVFTCADLPPARAVNILAHEFVHQLAHDRYGPRHLESDMLLLEGVATWGAGSYWLIDAPDFAAFVQPYQQNDRLLPLATSYVGRSIGDMNQLYYQWASFVEFLIDTYGREQFDALYITGSRAPGSADYVGVYGKDLATLESEWRASLQ